LLFKDADFANSRHELLAARALETSDYAPSQSRARHRPSFRLRRRYSATRTPPTITSPNQIRAIGERRIASTVAPIKTAAASIPRAPNTEILSKKVFWRRRTPKHYMKLLDTVAYFIARIDPSDVSEPERQEIHAI
jgi:hypothetical protein